MCPPVPWGLDSLPESQEKLKELLAMEDPGDTEAHPLGTANLNFVPGHQQKEKLVKLGGQLGAGGEGSDRKVWQRQMDRWEAQDGEEVLAQTPAQVCVSAPSPSPDPLYDTPDASRAQAGGAQQPARTVSLRERLLITRPVWLQLRANAAAALHVLRTEPPGVSLFPSSRTGSPRVGEKGPGHGGIEPPNPIHLQTFLVRKSNTRQCRALCVRLPEASGPSFVSSHYIQESPGGEGAGLAGRGWRQAGEGGPQRTASLPVSLRHLFGGFRARIPGPGSAHLCILPYQVSLPTCRVPDDHTPCT